MTPAKEGDTVKVHYVGRLDDGTEFDSSADREPIEFKIGDHEVIPGFENAIVGMIPGQSKTERIPADQAYGPHRPERVFSIERGDFPSDILPSPGQLLQVTDRTSGAVFRVAVVRVEGDQVVLDANHPLAGKTLTFEIRLVEIRPAA
jgi:peptidylprolyl isomerase